MTPINVGTTVVITKDFGALKNGFIGKVINAPSNTTYEVAFGEDLGISNMCVKKTHLCNIDDYNFSTGEVDKPLSRYELLVKKISDQKGFSMKLSSLELSEANLKKKLAELEEEKQKIKKLQNDVKFHVKKLVRIKSLTSDAAILAQLNEMIKL